VLQVVTPLEKNPQMIMWDPEQYPDVVAEFPGFQIPAEASLYVSYKDKTYTPFIVEQGYVTEDQLIDGYFGGFDKWVVDQGANFQQGFSSNEVWTYENDSEIWGKPIEYVLIDDMGYRTYAQALSINKEREEELAPCLEAFVPIVQQAAVDYAANPTEVEEAITAFNEQGYGEDFWTTPKELNVAGLEIMLEQGLVGNGPDGVAANFDLDRVNELIEVMGPTLDGESNMPDATAEDVVTNAYIDDSIGFP
jgi:hypothetical protein